MNRLFALTVALLVLSGCSYRSYQDGNIPLFRLKDLEEQLCSLRSGDTIHILKKMDSVSLINVGVHCEKGLFSDDWDWECRSPCQGWVSNTSLDSLIDANPCPGKWECDDFSVRRNCADGKIPLFRLQNLEKPICFLQEGDTVEVLATQDTLLRVKSRIACLDDKECKGWIQKEKMGLLIIGNDL